MSYPNYPGYPAAGANQQYPQQYGGYPGQAPAAAAAAGYQNQYPPAQYPPAQYPAAQYPAATPPGNAAAAPAAGYDYRTSGYPQAQAGYAQAGYPQATAATGYAQQGQYPQAGAGYAQAGYSQNYAQQGYAGYNQYGYNQQGYYTQPQVNWGVGRPEGKKKALLVGINYIRHRRGRLQGCINDVKNIYNFIVNKHQFPKENIRILTDDQQNPAGQPTRANIIAGMRWLVQGATYGDSLVFHFSGHGGQVEDLDGDESDGLDETIMPVDYNTAGHIIDDEINDILVKPLVAGVRLMALMDCCHSGTSLDLPYTHHIKGEPKPPKQKLDKQAKKQQKKIKKQRKKMKGKGGGGGMMYFPSDVIMFSGCRDDQTSADTSMGGEATGAMSYSFIKALSAKPQITYEQLLIEMRRILQGSEGRRFHQVPQMSASRPFNMNTWFYL